MEKFIRGLLRQIPAKNCDGIDTHYTSDVFIVRPTTYVVQPIQIPDYHFTLPVCDLPPMRIGNREYHFNRKRMLTFAPDTRANCLRSIPTRPYIAISIRNSFFEETAREMTGKSKVSFPNPDTPLNPALYSLIGAFEEEIAQFGHHCPLMLQSISTQIAIQLLRATGVSQEKRKEPDQRHYVEVAEEYIRTYFNSNIKIEDICAQINISPYHFIRMFRNKTGMTPHAYLQQVRIQQAEDMLQKGGYSIEEVAGLCGYISASHFSKYFRRVKGIPPSVYKKEHCRSNP